MSIKLGLYTYKKWLQCVEIVENYDGLSYILVYECKHTGAHTSYYLMATLEEEEWIKETFDYIGAI